MLYGRAAGSSYIGDHFDGTAHRGDDQCDLDSRYPMRRILILIPAPLTGTGRLAGVLRPFPGVAARNRGSAPSRVSYRSKFFHGSHDDWCRRLFAQPGPRAEVRPTLNRQHRLRPSAFHCLGLPAKQCATPIRPSGWVLRTSVHRMTG